MLNNLRLSDWLDTAHVSALGCRSVSDRYIHSVWNLYLPSYSFLSPELQGPVQVATGYEIRIKQLALLRRKSLCCRRRHERLWYELEQRMTLKPTSSKSQPVFICTLSSLRSPPTLTVSRLYVYKLFEATGPSLFAPFPFDRCRRARLARVKGRSSPSSVESVGARAGYASRRRSSSRSPRAFRAGVRCEYEEKEMRGREGETQLQVVWASSWIGCPSLSELECWGPRSKHSPACKSCPRPLLFSLLQIL